MGSDQSEQIRLHHVPIGDGIVTASLSLVLLAIAFGLLRLWSIGDRELSMLLIGAAVVALAASLFVARTFITLAVSEVMIDKDNHWVEITRVRLFGKRKDRYSFHNIEKFKSYKAKRLISSPSSHYSLEIVLVNKKKVKVRVTIGRDQGETTKFIKSLNKALKQSKLPATGSVRE